MDGYVLSIDQGTTGTTALVFDQDGRVRGRGYSEFTPLRDRGGGAQVVRAQPRHQQEERLVGRLRRRATHRLEVGGRRSEIRG